MLNLSELTYSRSEFLLVSILKVLNEYQNAAEGRHFTNKDRDRLWQGVVTHGLFLEYGSSKMQVLQPSSVLSVVLGQPAENTER